jgi:predicted nucleic acid-binding protein
VPDILGSVLVDAGPLIAAAVKRDRYHRSAVEWFRDHPRVALITTLMDFADASIVVASEKLGIADVLSVDHDDFDVYRSTKGRPFHNWFPRLR